MAWVEGKHGWYDDTHRQEYRKQYGEIPKGYHVHHIDGDHSNNARSNLIALPGQLHLKIHSVYSKESLPSRRELIWALFGWEAFKSKGSSSSKKTTPRLSKKELKKLRTQRKKAKRRQKIFMQNLKTGKKPISQGVYFELPWNLPDVS